MHRPKTLQSYVEHLNGLAPVQHNSAVPVVSGATSDSREVQPGWVFCAIKGAQADGAAFIPDAIRSGAVAVVAAAPVSVPPDVALVTVNDTYAAAGRLAEVAYDFPARSLDVLGITGTNGKTTCAFLLHAILSAAGGRAGMVGTVFYRIGAQDMPASRTTPTPFHYQSLLRRMVDAGDSSVVVEVSSHALHQRRIGTIPLKGALFTNLSGDHLDYHGDLDSYFEAKKILFDEYLHPQDPVVANADDAYGVRLLGELRASGRQRVSGFGHAGDADYRITGTSMSPDASCFVLHCPRGTNVLVRSPLIGAFNVNNLAAVAALALELGLPPAAITAALADCVGAPGRLERIDTHLGFTAFIDYAHTDDALHNVLTTLRNLEPTRLLVVFGCGGDRDTSKRPRMGRVAAELADRVYVTSDNPRSEAPDDIIAQIKTGMTTNTSGHIFISDRREAIRTAVRDSRPGDILLIAGKGHESYQEISGKTLPFDDAAETRKALEALGT